MRLPSMAAACALAAVGSAALADPADLTRSSGPNTYFNRPGADMATHDREVLACLALAARAHQPSTAFSPSFVVNDALNRETAAKSTVALSANTENCMVVRGWRVVALPPEEADAMAKLDRASQAQRLSEWVGAPTPRGMIVRQWDNDLANAATIKMKTGPWSGRPSISLSAIDPAAVQRALSAAAGAANPAPRLAAPLTADAIASAPRDQAVVVIRVAGPSLHNGDTIVLRREAPATSGANAAEGDTFLAYANPFWERSGKWSAFAAPPGRWRIESIGGDRVLFEVRLCLGSPAFAANAGEVVYAGTFDLGSAAMRPDLALDPVRAWLSHSGDAAGRVRPAAYANGSTGACGGTYIYAYAIPGAPYEPGYVGGGAPSAP